MNQQITHRQAFSVPSLAEVEKTLSSSPLVEKLTKFVAPEADSYLPGTPITDAHRADLLAYSERVETWLQDRRPERNIGLVSMILTALPHRGMSEGTASIKLAAFKIALEDMPTWAIDMAINRWLKGDIGDGGFAPSPPQLRQAAQSVAMTVWAKARQAKKLAELPVQRKVTDDERKRIADLMATVKLRTVKSAIRPKTEKETLAEIEAERAAADADTDTPPNPPHRV